MDTDKIKKLACRIQNSGNIVFFGGAGVSTESGMKDYRSEDGLYNTVRKYKVSPEVILSHSFFQQCPDIFYDFYYNYFLESNATPNRAHNALAQLEKMGMLKAVITQNVDGLHQMAGSRNVIELHGTMQRHYCASCGAPFPNETVKACKGAVPTCPGCGGVIRPDIVLYEEPLDAAVIDSAVAAISSADMLIIGGTSLAVYPAASFIQHFKGDNIVLINRDETQYDTKAALVFRESIGEVLHDTMHALAEEY